MGMETQNERPKPTRNAAIQAWQALEHDPGRAYLIPGIKDDIGELGEEMKT